MCMRVYIIQLSLGPGKAAARHFAEAAGGVARSVDHQQVKLRRHSVLFWAVV